ncbi:MAG: CBS domain-containing protein [Thermoleophilia bacterium]
MPSGGDIRAEVVVTSHQNVDFDAFAAAVAATKLYPDARVVFAGSMNPNVRDFVSLHSDHLPLLPLRSLDRSSVRTLIVVDTSDCSRLGELGELCERDEVDVIIFDHHQGEFPERPPFVKRENWVTSRDGSQSASMVHILLERNIPISPEEATIFALGIHEDTGSLTYPRTTVRDAEMLAVCMRLGASQTLIEHYLHSPLTVEQRDLLMRLADELQVLRIRGHDVHVVGLKTDQYVDGLSVLAHKLMDLLNSEVLLQAVGMEDRVFVTGRSKTAAVDVGALMESLGGGGHPQAGSAVVRDADPSEIIEQILVALRRSGGAQPTAEDIMSRPVRFIEAETPVGDALVAAQRYGHSGISVREKGRFAGIVARRDLDKAMRHGLGHAPVKGVMSRDVVLAPQSATVDELRRLMVDTSVGRLPVVSDEAYRRLQPGEAPLADEVLGIVTRTDVLAAYQAGEAPDRPVAAQTRITQPLSQVPFLERVFRAASALSDDFEGVYLVGGFVRDLLLGQPNADVDIAVEGDGIEFARRLATQLGGRIRAHRKFQTAVVLLPPEALGDLPDWLTPTDEPFHVDVATSRTEFYEAPAALPQVEHASIRQDLFRRDFTINAMAISLKGEDFGTVYDFYGGLKDLESGVIRVLHNLSFIEDPTRIFRAVRYENRYGFRMDEHTLSLARGCVDMHLVGDLSSARLRDELTALFGERDVDWTLERLYELGVAREVHPKLATGPRTVALIHRLDEAINYHGLRDEVCRWRVRLSAVARNMAGNELTLWLERLKLKHADAEVVRSSVIVAPRVAAQLAEEQPDDWETYRLLRRLPVEAVVFALARAESSEIRDRLSRYLSHLRRLELEITGSDVIALGLPQGPGVGKVLEDLRRRTIVGEISGREQQLEAARRLVEERRAGVTGGR